MKKNFFVYDTSKGFALFMKYNYSTTAGIESCGYKKKFSIDDPERYDASFFIINSVDDFILFNNCYSLMKNIFVSTPINLLKEKIISMGIDDMVVLDFTHPKSEVLKTINQNLIAKNIL
jgi:hypothetical protein